LSGSLHQHMTVFLVAVLCGLLKQLEIFYYIYFKLIFTDFFGFEKPTSAFHATRNEWLAKAVYETVSLRLAILIELINAIDH